MNTTPPIRLKAEVAGYVAGMFAASKATSTWSYKRKTRRRVARMRRYLSR